MFSLVANCSTVSSSVMQSAPLDPMKRTPNKFKSHVYFQGKQLNYIGIKEIRGYSECSVREGGSLF